MRIKLDDLLKIPNSELDNVKVHTDGKEIVKVVVIPKKIVNIVVK